TYALTGESLSIGSCCCAAAADCCPTSTSCSGEKRLNPDLIFVCADASGTSNSVSTSADTCRETNECCACIGVSPRLSLHSLQPKCRTHQRPRLIAGNRFVSRRSNAPRSAAVMRPSPSASHPQLPLNAPSCARCAL